MNLWSGRWSEASWRAYLDEGITNSNLDTIRRSTHSGRLSWFLVVSLDFLLVRNVQVYDRERLPTPDGVGRTS